MIALGERTLLMLPQRGEIGFGHCFIVPLEHVSSVTAVDEDVYTEIKNFKKCVARMYATMVSYLVNQRLFFQFFYSFLILPRNKKRSF